MTEEMLIVITIIITFFVGVIALMIYDKFREKKFFGTIVIDKTGENGPLIFLEINGKNCQNTKKHNDQVVLNVKVRKWTIAKISIYIMDKIQKI